jgi:uncharacterized protein
MSTHELPDYHAVQQSLESMALTGSAGEFHGSLCGYLCAGGSVASGWMARIMLDEEAPDPERGSDISVLFDATRQTLESPDFEFSLLLPEQDRPVGERADALVDWCRGFLGGFGLVPDAQSNLGEEANDAINDFAKIAASDLSYDDPDADEEALEEVAEYVRVGALLVHSDCVLGPRHRRTLN